MGELSLRSLDEQTFVSGQIMPADMADVAARGVAMIVNNRLDGEEPGQPEGADVEAAARAAGIDYRHIPVAGGFGPEEIEAMAAAIEAAEGKLLAFCRSGTRSAFLWAVAQRRRGVDGATILALAEAAGYDLSPLKPYLG